MARVKSREDDALLRGVAEELSAEGIEILDSTLCLLHLVAPKGVLTRRNPSAAQWDDIDLGFRTAKEIGRLGIGQTVVVKNGTVLAVEAFEGTDRCLKRGGELAGKEGGAVAVKVAKTNHDMRFDIPCVGPLTLETCTAVGISVLALESGRTLLLEQETCERLAVKNRITVTTVG